MKNHSPLFGQTLTDNNDEANRSLVSFI